jgi:molybdopterin converting factor subunit 1
MKETDPQSICIQLFAVARQLVGADTINLELPSGSTIGQLRERLCELVPAIRPVMSHVRFAVNADYADDKTVIPAGADVACIPPVSGG